MKEMKRRMNIKQKLQIKNKNSDKKNLPSFGMITPVVVVIVRRCPPSLCAWKRREGGVEGKGEGEA